MSFRKEKKIRLTKSEYYELKHTLCKQGMTALHTQRRVNSVYFDNLSRQMYFESEEGVVPRKKIRVRWYNNSTEFALEKKISSIEGRFKTTESMRKNLSEKDILTTSLFDKDYGSVFPTLKVSYNRTYFTLDRMRLTFDADITYRNLRRLQDSDFQDPEHVVEVKVPAECGDDFVNGIIPFATSRFSKYSRGLLATEKQL